MNQEVSKRTLFVLLLALLVVLWGLLYAYPRLNSIHELEKRQTGLRSERDGITRAMQNYARSRTNKVVPNPNTATWLNNSVIKKFEKNVEVNNPYNNSQGVHVKLRAVTAEQMTELLDSLRNVNLIFKTFKLDDADGDGRWDVEFMIEVPS